MYNYNNIPDELKNLDQWVLHEDKKPVQSDGNLASSTKSSTWGCFKAMIKHSIRQKKGLSFALNNDYIGIDLDNCYNGFDELKDWAKDIVNNLKNAYIEKSIGGKGLHIFIKRKRELKCKGKKGICFKLGMYKETRFNLTEKEQILIEEDSKNITKDAIEIYQVARFLTMSGDVIQNPKTEDGKIGEHQEYVENLFKQLIEIATANSITKKQKKYNTEFTRIKSKVSIYDILKFYNNDTIANGFTNCPFHKENVKSLYIYSITNSWYCFGCQKGGDIYTYVQLIESINNFEALKFIAKKFKIELDLNRDKKKIHKKIYIDNGIYYYIGADSLKALTNFTVKVNNYIELEVYSMDVDVVIDGIVYNGIMNINDFKDKSSFKNKIHKLTNGRGSVYCNDVQVEYIKDMVFIEVETIKGLSYSGIIQEKDNYFFIDNESKMLCTTELENKYTVLNNRISINTDILNDTYDYNKYCLSDYSNLIENILNFNNKYTMLTTLLYMCSCFFKSRLFDAKIKFPHLNLCSESQTGKTTIKSYIIESFFSLLNGQSVASTRHPINCSLSSNNTIPLVIDEFKVSKMNKIEQKIWSEINRLAFECQVYSKGRKDLNSDSYKYISPIIFIGESSFSDLADRNRCIDIYTRKYHDIDEINKLTNIQNYLITNENILQCFGKLVLETSLNYTVKDLKDLYVYYRSMIDRLQPRNMDSLASILISLNLLKKVFDKFDFNFLDLIDEDEKDIVKNMEEMQFITNQGGRNMSMSIIPKTLDIFDLMFDTNILTKGYHIVSKGEDIVIHLKRVYPEYTRYLRDYNIDIETMNYDSFMSQFKQSIYFKKYDNASFNLDNAKFKPKKTQQKGYYLNVEQLNKDNICSNFLDLLEN
jgi:putative DNA primase/helicase